MKSKRHQASSACISTTQVQRHSLSGITSFWNNRHGTKIIKGLKISFIYISFILTNLFFINYLILYISKKILCLLIVSLDTFLNKYRTESRKFPPKENEKAEELFSSMIVCFLFPSFKTGNQAVTCSWKNTFFFSLKKYEFIRVVSGSL